MLVHDNWTHARRNCYFNKSITSIANYFGNLYPIILMNTRAWREEEKKSIRTKWPTLTSIFIDIRQYFDTSLFKESEVYLSSIQYKKMIKFFWKGFSTIPLIRKFRYVLRMDDDTCFRSQVKYDFFQRMKKSSAQYGFATVVFDSLTVSNGFLTFIEDYSLRNKLSIHKELKNISDFFQLNYRLVPNFGTHLEVIDIRRYLRNDIQRFIDTIIDSEFIFSRRWGDALLR
jgi:hypothetical protein